MIAIRPAAKLTSFCGLILSSLLILALSAACVSSPKSKSNPGAGNLTAQFNRADTNQDGRVSLEEFRYLMIEDMFALFDHNEDGFVTRQEFIQAGGTPATFDKIDRAGLGKVTVEQVQSARIPLDRVSAAFYAADTDKDGCVTLAEALDYREKVRAVTR